MENYQNIKIFIPTKGRLNNEKTYELLIKLGLKPIIVVEPQEYSKAVEMGYNCLMLDKNNQGITYARNFILDYCRNNHIKAVHTEQSFSLVFVKKSLFIHKYNPPKKLKSQAK